PPSTLPVKVIPGGKLLALQVKVPVPPADRVSAYGLFKVPAAKPFSRISIVFITSCSGLSPKLPLAGSVTRKVMSKVPATVGVPLNRPPAVSRFIPVGNTPPAILQILRGLHPSQSQPVPPSECR